MAEVPARNSTQERRLALSLLLLTFLLLVEHSAAFTIALGATSSNTRRHTSTSLADAEPSTGADSSSVDLDSFDPEKLANALGASGRRKRRRDKQKKNGTVLAKFTKRPVKLSYRKGVKNKAKSVSTKSKETMVKDEATIAAAEIASVTLIQGDGDIALFQAQVHLHNGTQFIVEDTRNLNQRTDQYVWLAIRKTVNVTASEFSAVLDTSYFTSREKLLAIKRGLVSPAPFNQQACDWGLRMEPKALATYVEHTGFAVEETGLHIASVSSSSTSSATQTNKYYLGASPDGLVTDPSNTTHPLGLLEIKSLWGRRNVKELPVFDHCPNRFYAQIQGQLAICDREWCDLIIYIPPRGAVNKANKKSHKRHRHYSIVRVHRNRTYWETEMKPALETFVEELRSVASTSTTVAC